MDEPRSLGDILTAPRNACHSDSVSIGDVLDELGHSSFATALLVPALILVSPVSGIPGAPTLGSIVIAVIALNALAGADHLWVPQFIQRWHMPQKRLAQAVKWLEKPAAWVDARTEQRITMLAKRPWRSLAFIVTLAVACIMPFLEVLPLVTSVACFGISLLALGIMVRDGFLMLGGYAMVATFAVAITLLIGQISG